MPMTATCNKKYSSKALRSIAQRNGFNEVTFKFPLGLNFCSRICRLRRSMYNLYFYEVSFLSRILLGFCGSSHIYYTRPIRADSAVSQLLQYSAGLQHLNIIITFVHKKLNEKSVARPTLDLNFSSY